MEAQLVALIACLIGAGLGVFVAMKMRGARRRAAAILALAVGLGLLAFLLYQMSLRIPFFVPIAFGFLFAYLFEDAKAFKRIR